MSRITLNTDEKAIAYIIARGQGDKIEDGRVKLFAGCKRCGGTGKILTYTHVEGGICFQCNGADTSDVFDFETVQAYAKKLRAAELRQGRAKAKKEKEKAEKEQRMLEGQRDWCEANGYGRVTFEEKRAVEEARRAEKVAKLTHVGALKERLRDIELTLVFRTAFDGFYGRTFLLKFEDQSGNVIVWKTSSPILASDGTAHRKGDRITVDFTVKAHDDYKGTPQTVVTRLNVKSEILTDRDAA